MDVLCVGMYRSCSTWQYEVASHLVESRRRGRRLGFLAGVDYADRARRRAPDDRWVVLKSHEGHRSFADELKEGRARGIYAYRDLREVAYSLMHKRRLTFSELIRRGMLHQVVRNDRFWTSLPGMLVQRYESLIDDPAAGVAQIASHLGIAIEDGQADCIAAEYSFERNLQRAERLRRRLRAMGVDLDDLAASLVYDDSTLLHWNHLREARVDGWRDRSSEPERSVLARVGGDWLIRRGYEADRSWGERCRPSGARARVREGWEVARGDLACRLRGLSDRFPKLSSTARRALRVPEQRFQARPATSVAGRGPDRLRADLSRDRQDARPGEPVGIVASPAVH